MKLGILGTGMIVKDMLKMINTIGFEEIYLLATPATKEEAEGLQEQYGLSTIYYDYDELLGSDVDVIYVALPNFLHYSFSKKALEAGKHVIIEKPVTANAGELEDLIALSHERKLMIFEAMNTHYLPAFLSLKENLKLVGNVKMVMFNYSQYSSRYNAFKAGQILPAFDYHKAGGALMDLNVYNLHALIDLFGAPSKVEYHANIEKGIDTSGVMFMDYENFKVVSVGAKDCKAPINSTIQGDNGVLIINRGANSMNSYRYINNQNEETVFDCDEGLHRLSYEFVEFKKMLDEKDFERQEAMIQMSLNVAKVMEEGRKYAGIVFDNDKR